MTELESAAELLTSRLVAVLHWLIARALVDGAVDAHVSARREEWRFASASSPAALASAAGRKRTHAQLTALRLQLFAFIAANPGSTMVQINAALGTERRELVVPMRQLAQSGRITVRGHKRWTAYYVAEATRDISRPDNPGCEA